MAYPTLYTDPSFVLPSVARLSGPITINSITETPDFRYIGGDATTAEWTTDGYGTTIPIAGAGNDVMINQGSLLLGADDDSCNGDGGKYFQMASSATYDITTEDFVLEVVVKKGTTSSGRILDKRGAAGAGYYLTEENGSNQITLFIEDDSTNSASINSPTLVDGNWYKLTFYIDKSGSGICYANAAAGSAVDVSSVGTLTNSDDFTIFADSDGNNDSSTTKIAYLAMWTRSTWLDTHLQATVDKARFYQLTALEAIKANGTALPPTSIRASTAYLEKYTGAAGMSYLVGNNWIRAYRFADGSSTREGICSESSSTNIAAHSEDLDSWTKTGCTIDSDNTNHPAPFEGKYFDGIIPDNGTGNHRPGVSTTGNMAAVRYVISGYFKKGNMDWVCIYNSCTGATASYAWFNLNTGAFGTLSNATAAAEEISSGIYRFKMTTTTNRAVQLGNNLIFSATADNTFTNTGDGATVATWVFGMQCEQGVYPSSYIGLTTVSAVTRAADSVIYKMDDGNMGGVGSERQGTIKFMFATGGRILPIAMPLARVYDASTASNRINIRINTDNYIEAIFDMAGGTTRTAIGPAVDVTDSDWHCFILSWRPGRIIAYVDCEPGTAITAGVEADMPIDLDSFTFYDARISKLQVFRRPIWSGRKFTR